MKQNLVLSFAMTISWLWVAFPASNYSLAVQPCVLMIGIDGLRTDALDAAKTPNIDRLIEQGLYSPATFIHTDRFTKSDTVSGPGWTTFLTGVWADKHGVIDNTFRGRDSSGFPHIFARIRESQPRLRLFSGLDWEPLTQHVPSGADVDVLARIQGDDHALAYSNCDDQLSFVAAGALGSGKIEVAFVYFGAVDETGHRDGFHPSVPSYIAAIEKTDERIGRLLDAVQRRETRREENWLFLVGTDHGGRGKDHGGNRNVPEVCQVPLIVSGASAAKTLPNRRIESVDLVACTVAHLGIEPLPQWGLDGTASGLLLGASPSSE